MLIRMDIPVAAGPWLVLGLVLGILLPALAALGALGLRRRSPRAPAPPATAPPATAAPSAGFGEDDLPAFLEAPPGSSGPPAARREGWTTLGSAPAAEPAAEAAPPPERTGSNGVLIAMAVAALLLVGAAAAVAATRTHDADGLPEHGGNRTAERSTRAPGPAEVSARLTFEGVVLERHAVGVTVAYPRVRLTGGGGTAVAEIELPTFNCLLAEAPADPVAAGCTRSVTEYAEVTAPALSVHADDTGIRLSGRFPTELRPNGSPPVATGRVYELAVRAAARDGSRGEGPEPAEGVLELGADQVGTSDEGPNEITVER
jgi:hypothetical protein